VLFYRIFEFCYQPLPTEVAELSPALLTGKHSETGGVDFKTAHKPLGLAVSPNLDWSFVEPEVPSRQIRTALSFLRFHIDLHNAQQRLYSLHKPAKAGSSLQALPFISDYKSSHLLVKSFMHSMPYGFCTDNAVMIASLAYHKYKANLFADISLEAKAGSDD
jgi:hypothetical protein